MFICDFDVKVQSLDVIVQRFYHVLEFTAVDTLFVDEFLYLYDVGWPI